MAAPCDAHSCRCSTMFPQRNDAVILYLQSNNSTNQLKFKTMYQIKPIVDKDELDKALDTPSAESHPLYDNAIFTLTGSLNGGNGSDDENPRIKTRFFPGFDILIEGDPEPKRLSWMSLTRSYVNTKGEVMTPRGQFCTACQKINTSMAGKTPREKLMAIYEQFKGRRMKASQRFYVKSVESPSGTYEIPAIVRDIEVL